MIHNGKVKIHCDKNVEYSKNAFSKNRLEFKTVEGRECFYTKCMFAQTKGNNSSATMHQGLLFLSHDNK